MPNDFPNADDLKNLERVFGKLAGPFTPSGDEQKLRDTVKFKLTDDVSFEVDQKIVSLVEACWKSGVFVLQSDAWSNSGTVRLHFPSTTFADQFLTNILSDGELYWSSGQKSSVLSNWTPLEMFVQITPEDWHWEMNFEFMFGNLENPDLIKSALAYLKTTPQKIADEMTNEPSVIVRFPYEFSHAITERLRSKESNRPQPEGKIWEVLPDLSCFDPSYFF
ncbi:MAG: hypothetical protein CL387_07025 [Acidiferrobacter sp.]|jgi:hypothetical protein|nr:hypothetical protein [Acidiferrobacter sp.]|tara:strand:+ start:109 stop:771 length:663 start_codon:yes stop_codon:yes gene_type:complete